MKYTITIAAPIYPPEIGGPSHYAEMLVSGFGNYGDTVRVVTYGGLKKLPTVIRHIAYFFRLFPTVVRSQYVVALDTFSAAFPAVCMARLLGKKIIVRVGGDFLWEEYVERTEEVILLSDFYTHSNDRKDTYSLKEKIIFFATKCVFIMADKIVFSTKWQRDIMTAPYDIDQAKTVIIENMCVERKKRNVIPKQRVILSPSRNRFLKNKVALHKAFAIIKNRFADVLLDTDVSEYSRLLERISQAYCLVVPSFSEVSPNIVLDAVSLGVPVVVTRDCGIRDRLQECVVWIDPRDSQSIVGGIEKLLDAHTYSEYMNRISAFSFIHTQENIVNEYRNIFETL